MEDVKARMEFGLKKYGSLLQAHNGRDTLQDAYEEILDLAVYIRTLISERAGDKDTALQECEACIVEIQHIRSHFTSGSASWTALGAAIIALQGRHPSLKAAIKP